MLDQLETMNQFQSAGKLPSPVTSQEATKKAKPEASAATEGTSSMGFETLNQPGKKESGTVHTHSRDTQSDFSDAKMADGDPDTGSDGISDTSTQTGFTSPGELVKAGSILNDFVNWNYKLLTNTEKPFHMLAGGVVWTAAVVSLYWLFKLGKDSVIGRAFGGSRQPTSNLSG